MKIIIVGCGKLGTTLAEQLRDEDHELVIVDTNPAKIQQLSESIDVMGVTGNGSSIQVLSEAGVEEADILIAVTGRAESALLPDCKESKQLPHHRPCAQSHLQ